MPNLSEYETTILDRASREAFSRLCGDDIRAIAQIATRISDTLGPDFLEILRHLESGEWSRISRDEMQIFAMELERRNGVH